jgi:hypothetical protein
MVKALWELLPGAPAKLSSTQSQATDTHEAAIVKAQARIRSLLMTKLREYGAARKVGVPPIRPNGADTYAAVIATFGTIPANSVSEHSPTRRHPKGWFRLRFDVFHRDGFKCTYCGFSGTAKQLQVDHIRPVSDDGTNEMANLVTACKECNIGKGAKKGVEVKAIQ